MRGAVSLAAALAVPLTVDGGGAFPHRDLIIYLTFSVILGTLLLQGLTLPWLIKMLGVDDHDEALEAEENIARLAATETALARLEELRGEEWVLDDTVDRVSGTYRYRQRRFNARVPDGEFDGGIDGDGVDYEARSEAYQRLVRELLDAQRETLLELRNRGEINDDVMRRIERELDLEDARLEI
jgi:CPA1 family monovalent cation:H+ antiporter